MENLGSKLKEERLKRNLTQAEMAELLSLKRSTYSLYEAGKRQPRLEQIEDFANTLNIDDWELYEGYVLRSNKGKADFQKAIKDLTDIIESSTPSAAESATEVLSTVSKNATTAPSAADMAIKAIQNGIISDLDKLNETGQKEAAKRVQELTEIPKYRKPSQD